MAARVHQELPPGPGAAAAAASAMALCEDTVGKNAIVYVPGYILIYSMRMNVVKDNGLNGVNAHAVDLGKVKYTLDYDSYMKQCVDYTGQNEGVFKNEHAIKFLVEKRSIGNFFGSQTLEVCDLYVVDKVERYFNVRLGLYADINLYITFLHIKRFELLTKTFITANSLINIISRAIINASDLSENGEINHAYKMAVFLDSVCKDNDIFDKRFQCPPWCKTNLFLTQLTTLAWAANIEQSQPTVKFTDDKIFKMDWLGMWFNYTRCGGQDPKPFFKFDELPEYVVKGGIICDEPGTGKTIQGLIISLSTPDIKTLILVPTDLIKTHWYSELDKHFTFNSPRDVIYVMTYEEFKSADKKALTIYSRLIVDEIHELYSTNEKYEKNNVLFRELLGMKQFKFRWGISATPFIGQQCMTNIIRFLIGSNTIYNNQIGKYNWVHETFKPFFHRYTKQALSAIIHLPSVNIINVVSKFNEAEQRIYDAELSAQNQVDKYFLRKLCASVLSAISESDCNTITTKQLMILTVDRFKNELDIQLRKLEELEKAHSTVESKIRDVHQNKEIDDKMAAMIISEYMANLEHIRREIIIQKKAVESRNTVYTSYLEMTKRIETIIKPATPDAGADDDVGDDDVGDDVGDNACPICYSEIADELIITHCRQCVCKPCYDLSQSTRPNICPCCNDRMLPGSVMCVRNDNKKIIGTKNTEILRIINSKRERFIIFTQFDNLIRQLHNLLTTNDINTCVFSDYFKLPAEKQDKVQVIIMSSTSNASGVDLSFIHNVIIIEPFENYIYGKEIEKQLIGRVHRIGQTREVDVFRLIIKDTIEESMYSM